VLSFLLWFRGNLPLLSWTACAVGTGCFLRRGLYLLYRKFLTVVNTQSECKLQLYGFFFLFPVWNNTQWVVDDFARGRMCAGYRDIDCSYAKVNELSARVGCTEMVCAVTKPPSGTALFFYSHLTLFFATSPQNPSVLYILTLGLHHLSCSSRCAVPSCITFLAANMHVIDWTGFLLAAVMSV
jgi:hypothetical protein